MSDQAGAAGNGFWADAASERALDRYATLVDMVDDGIYQLDAEGRFLAVNDAIVELTGHSRAELLDEHVSAVLAEEDVSRIQDEISRRLTDVDRENEPIEFTAQTADGDTIPCDLELHLLVEEGTFEGTIGIVRDVTDRKRTERELRQRERELEQKERRYEAIFEDPNILVGLLDPDGTVRDINQTAMEYIEADLDAVTGDPFWETPWWGEGDGVRDDVKEWVERAAAGEYVDFEADLTRPDGEPYTLSGYFRPVTDDGEVVSIIVSDRDITERKEHERELELFRTLLDHSSDAVFVNDPETGRILDVNDTAARQLGYERDELTSLTIPDIDTELPSREAWQSFVRELQAAGSTTVQGEIRRKDGSTYPVEVNATYVELDREYVLGIARDVTERREMEAKLQEREERFRQITEHIEEVFWMTPPDKSGMTYVSPAYEEIWGRSRESLYEEPTTFIDAVHPEDRERVRDALDRQPEGEYDEVYRVVRPDGEVRWVRDRAFPIEDDDGEVYRVVGVAMDITERQERERELREVNSQLEAAIEAGAVGTWEWSVPDDELVAGEAFARTLGVDPEEAEEGVPLDRFLSAIHEDDHDRVADAIDDVLETCGEYEEEYRVRNADGELRWVLARGHVECDEQGNPISFPGTLVDITKRKRTERELQETTEQLETLFDVLPVGVVVGEADGSLVRANDVAREIWGGDVFDADSVEEYDRYTGWWADTGEQVAPDEWTMARVLDGETVTEPDVFEIEAADGERRTIEIRGMPIRNDDGEVVKGVLTQSDVTERRKYRRRLETSERRHRTLIENFPSGAVALFDEDLEYTAVGGEYFDEAGIDLDERIGNSVYQLYPDDIVKLVKPHFEAALEGEETEFEVEFNDRHLRVQVVPVRDADGEIYAGMAVAQDVTERKEREQALQESRNQLRALIDVLPVAVFVAEDDGEIVEWNEAGEEVWGGEIAASESVAEYDAYEAWWAETGEPVAPEEWPLARALEGEEVTDPDEIRIKGFDGEFRTVLNHGMPVRDADGEVSRAVVTLVDITDREEYHRKLEESNERLQQFAYAASHDLQEPLRMVSSYLQLIENRYGDQLDEDGQEFLEFAVDGADRMQAMIEGLLEYSRVETQGDPFEPVALEDVLDDVLDDLQFAIEETDAEITSESLPTVEADASQLRQVFQNLLDNAIEYSGDEPPRIHVGAERDGDEWIVSVRDEGVGIDPEDADRIFEVFQRLHSHDEHSGTGIGLALCKRIVERHGSDIWVESEPGEGTTFSFTLPAADSPDQDHN